MNEYWYWWGQKFSKLLIDYRLVKTAYKLSHESNRLVVAKYIIIHYKPKTSQTSIKLVQDNMEVTDPKQLDCQCL